MLISKAYADYLRSVRSGWSKAAAIEHACDCWGVTADGLQQHIRIFGHE